MTITGRDRLRQIKAAYRVASVESVTTAILVDRTEHEADEDAHPQYVHDAPSDGRQYVRQDGAWVETAAVGMIAVGGFYFNLTGTDPTVELGYGVWTLVGTLHIVIP